ncbi:MAG: isoprenylcysteine carboxylmethyltransferase family protein [Erysipelotrichaceae bacterium]|nr:isoprenylcysteine carboxylmethyltransferase family protein [Erysipelotrichaceae bacterium]MBQ4253758.1 isoprenylcysteine carboxylmethyltransferase family protein [Erysipelotrichaceae bacterium]
MNLLKEALVKYIAGVIGVGILLFLPAGSLGWKHGWLFMAVLFIPMLLAGIVMYLKAPDLLRSRLKAKETQKQQKDVINYSGLMFLAAFILAGLNYRFGWTALPQWVVTAGCIIFLLSYLMFGEVLRENAYLSRTIEVQENQKVVDTGLYGVVRHPMYAATVFLFLSMPLILNCWPSFVIMLAYFPIIAKRTLNEEQVLSEQLEGYDEYMKKIKYRIIPFIW